MADGRRDFGALDKFEGPGEADDRREERPRPPRRWLHPVLFLLTCLTTTFAGVNMANELQAGFLFYEPLLFVINDPKAILSGLPFSISLMAIFITHEMGHYIVARLYGVDATLPYFIPLPFALGTLGAVIGMPPASKNRGALLEIGAAGPLAGFVVAVIVLLIGFSLSEVKSAEEIAAIAATTDYVVEGDSIIYALARWLIFGTLEPGADVWIHPVATAGWFGVYLTWLNLQPFSQFDGGHVAYAIIGPKARYLTMSVFVYLPLLAILTLNPFWLSLTVLHIILGRLIGFDHPPVEKDKTIRGRHKLVAFLCMLVFLACFVPSPWQQVRSGKKGSEFTLEYIGDVVDQLIDSSTGEEP